MVPSSPAIASTAAASAAVMADENKSVDARGCATACAFTARNRAENDEPSAPATCAEFTRTGLSASSFAGSRPSASTAALKAPAAHVPNPLALANGSASTAFPTASSTASCPSK